MRERLMGRDRFRLLLNPNLTAIPTYGSMTSGTHIGETETNFDSNMVIILTAFLGALLCALGLNSIVRCILRCTRRYGPEAADGHLVAAARLASGGLKKETASQIPAVVYRSGLHIPATDCPICLGEFVEGEDVRIFPRCNHGFHVKCIDRWLALHASCPTCRRPLVGHPTVADTQHVRIDIR